MFWPVKWPLLSRRWELPEGLQCLTQSYCLPHGDNSHFYHITSAAHFTKTSLHYEYKEAQ